MEVQTSSSVWRRVVTMDEQAVPVRKLQSNDGTAIAFEQSGDGPPVILVGSAFNDRSGTAPLAAALAARLTVFNDDRRGRGDSGDTAAYSVAREIQDLDALIAQAGGSSAVFGHSSGATLALHAAAHGLAITKLALYEPPFLVDQSRPRPPADLPRWRPSPTPSSMTRRSSATSPSRPIWSPRSRPRRWSSTAKTACRCCATPHGSWRTRSPMAGPAPLPARATTSPRGNRASAAGLLLQLTTALYERRRSDLTGRVERRASPTRSKAGSTRRASRTR